MRNRRTRPVRFRWIDWNRDKVAQHGLSPEEVEFAWHRSLAQRRRRPGGTLENIGRIPSGRQIRIVWKWDEELDAWADEGVSRVVFVITAYGMEA